MTRAMTVEHRFILDAIDRDLHPDILNPTDECHTMVTVSVAGGVRDPVER